MTYAHATFSSQAAGRSEVLSRLADLAQFVFGVLPALERRHELAFEPGRIPLSSVGGAQLRHPLGRASRQIVDDSALLTECGFGAFSH